MAASSAFDPDIFINASVKYAPSDISFEQRFDDGDV